MENDVFVSAALLRKRINANRLGIRIVRSINTVNQIRAPRINSPIELSQVKDSSRGASIAFALESVNVDLRACQVVARTWFKADISPPSLRYSAAVFALASPPSEDWCA